MRGCRGFSTGLSVAAAPRSTCCCTCRHALTQNDQRRKMNITDESQVELYATIPVGFCKILIYSFHHFYISAGWNIVFCPVKTNLCLMIHEQHVNLGLSSLSCLHFFLFLCRSGCLSEAFHNKHEHNSTLLLETIWLCFAFLTVRLEDQMPDICCCTFAKLNLTFCIFSFINLPFFLQANTCFFSTSLDYENTYD